jgi:hypothetical protein
MGINASFDVSRITNLEKRLDTDEALMVTTDDTAQQTIKSLSAPTFTAGTANITGINNSLIQTTAVANTQWIGGMENASTYYWALGKFASNSRVTELRSYMDNLILRSGRKAGATAGGITLITNDQNTAGINSDINLSPNVSTGGVVKVNSNLNMYPPNTSGFYFYVDASTNAGINWTDTAGTKAGCKLKFLTDGTAIQARKVDDSAAINFNAAAFVVGSMEDTKEEIEEYTEKALDKVMNTKVKKYKLKHHDNPRQEIGLIFEESPDEIKQDEGISLYNMCNMLWKAVQELTEKVNTLEGASK